MKQTQADAANQRWHGTVPAGAVERAHGADLELGGPPGLGRAAVVQSPLRRKRLTSYRRLHHLPGTSFWKRKLRIKTADEEIKKNKKKEERSVLSEEFDLGAVGRRELHARLLADGRADVVVRFDCDLPERPRWNVDGRRLAGVFPVHRLDLSFLRRELRQRRDRPGRRRLPHGSDDGFVVPRASDDFLRLLVDRHLGKRKVLRGQQRIPLAINWNSERRNMFFSSSPVQ